MAKSSLFSQSMCLRSASGYKEAVLVSAKPLKGNIEEGPVKCRPLAD